MFKVNLTGMQEPATGGGSWPTPAVSQIGNARWLQISAQAVVFDGAGRTVAELVPGANDVHHLAPGVYFIREPSAASGGRSAMGVRKVIVTR